MSQINYKPALPHLLAVVLFALIAVIYFFPAIQGYKLHQGDIEHHKGMAHEIKAHEKDFGERPLWTGNMFGGMPTYHISKPNFSGDILPVFFQSMMLFLPRPIGVLFALMLGFYILLMCLKIDPKLAVIGAIAFAFSSYFIVILDAGHNTKAHAIAFAPPVIGGLLLTLRGNKWIGFLVLAIFLALEIFSYHVQITYYTIIIVFALGIAELIAAIKSNRLNDFLKRCGIALLAVLLALLGNVGNLLPTYEYSKLSTRGKSELSITPTGEKVEDQSGGLSTEYITRWSYGIDETLTLLIPNAKGGRTGSPLASEDEIQVLRRENPDFFNILVTEYQKFQHPLDSYWGDQPFTSGPVYAGAIIVFLAIMAIIFIHTPLVVTLTVCMIFTIMLSWGKNFMPLTEFFIEHVPFYNKFRTVSMLLVVAEIILPLLAILFLNKLIKDRDFYQNNKKNIQYAFAGFVLLLGIMYVSPGVFSDFISTKEQAMFAERVSTGQQSAAMVDATIAQIRDYRISIFKESLFSSGKYVLFALVLILLFVYRKIKTNVFLLLIGAFVLIDLWSVDKRYLNNKENPAGASRAEGKYEGWEKINENIMPYLADAADKQILSNELKQHPEIKQQIQLEVQEERKEEGRLGIREIEDIQFIELMRNTHYRVLNTTTRLDQDSRTAYFHKSIGGYHAAKLERYQEVIDFEIGIEHYQLAQAFNRGGPRMVQQLLPQMNMLNMMNTKYIIGSSNGNKQAVLNPNALGNAWFVPEVEMVPNADSAILALASLDPSKKAVIMEKNLDGYKKLNKTYSSQGQISLTSYSPERMVYEYDAPQQSFVVFSEIYYDLGWKAYINGEEVDYTRVNFILRGMEVPAGSGKIVFEFTPKSIKIANISSWISSILFILVIVGVAYSEWKKRKEAV